MTKIIIIVRNYNHNNSVMHGIVNHTKRHTEILEVQQQLGEKLNHRRTFVVANDGIVLFLASILTAGARSSRACMYKGIQFVRNDGDALDCSNVLLGLSSSAPSETVPFHFGCFSD